MNSSLHQTGHNLKELAIEAVAFEPRGNQRIVVRPDRAQMIGKWVITQLGTREGTHPPAVKYFRRQQLLRRSSGAIVRGDAGPEGVTCVRSKNGSRTISVLQRQGVITFGKPEVSLELISQDTGLTS